MKPYAPILVILLLISTSFIGMSNKVDELTSEMEEWDEFPLSWFEKHYYPRPYRYEKYNLQEKEIPQRNSPDDIWNNTYGGSGIERGFCLDKTRDGGYIIVGWVNITESHTGDVWLIKTDMNGTMEWDKTFGGPYEDVPHCVRETKDGGFVIAGYYSNGKNGPFDAWLIKTDENGSMLWNWKYKGPYPETFGEYVIELDDGFLVMSNSWDLLTSYIWLVRTDLEGKELWNKTVDKPEARGQTIIQTRDGDFVIVGYFVKQLVLLTRIDENGNTLWRRTYEGYEGCGVFETDDDGFIISAGGSNAVIIRTNERGKELWSKTYHKTGGYLCHSFAQTSDGGYIVAGSTYDNNFDCILIKIDENGNKFWEMVIGGYERDVAYCAVESNDGNYILVGDTSSYGGGNCDIWLIKMPYFENQRPGKPSKPLGPTQVKPRTEYNYTTYASDPEGNRLYYKWDWGRGSGDVWIGPYNSSEPCIRKQSWLFRGFSNIKVGAMDENGGVSDWSDSLAVYIPKTKYMWFISLLSRFPLLYRLLDTLMDWRSL